MMWVLLVAGPPLVLGVILYNRLIADKNRVLQAWSDIAVQLKRRHDLIPKLVDAVRGYANYESRLLQDITRQRRMAEQTENPEQRATLERRLSSLFQRMRAVAEAYPQLKADAQYLDLMRQLSEVEEQIQYARRFYNGAVRNLNVRIESFPDLLIARWFGFHQAPFFELSDPAGTPHGETNR